MNCTISANQPIYQALIDKAASYPADKPYQAKAYKKAAEYVATMIDSIYAERGEFYGWWAAPRGSGIGFKTEEFINEFIKANPKPTSQQATTSQQVNTMYDTYYDWIMKERYPVYTPENPRRSRRLAKKPSAQQAPC